MRDEIRVVVVGLGPIGLAAAQAVAGDPTGQMRLVGVVDVDPGKVGRTVGELVGDGRGAKPQALGVRVSAEVGEAARGADVAIVCTTSHFDRLAPMLRELIGLKVHVVSSCEEMSWPWYRHAALAAEIDAEAKRAGVALLGTGVNPGYVMDLLAVQLSSMVTKVERVRCVRRVDASKRRRPLQQKVGSGMTVEQFDGLAREGKIGHKGIAESVALLAAGLGRRVEPGSVREGLEPVVAGRRLDSAVGVVEPGRVCGMRNTGSWGDEVLTVDLDLTMALGLEDPHDLVELHGSTPLSVRVPGATPGDTATIAALVNAARVLPRAGAGLKTMLDLPACGARVG